MTSRGRRRIPPHQGRAALERWELDPDATVASDVRTAVRFTLEELAHCHPGHALEVRVPPYGAVQALEGPRHTRGTPPSTIETDALTWLELVCGIVTFDDAVAADRVAASGVRSSLSQALPLFDESQAPPT